MPGNTTVAILLLLLATSGPAIAQSRPRFVNPPGMPASRGYTQLVEVPSGARMLFLSGQVALDSTGALVGAGDFRAQAQQIFRNLGAGLAAGCADFADVVKLTYYLRDVTQVPVLRQVRDQFVNTAAPPASTLVEVRRLARDDLLLEVEAVAVAPVTGRETPTKCPAAGKQR
jgi:2-iminobutanoate/2-iminopropanoate deaminase